LIWAAAFGHKRTFCNQVIILDDPDGRHQIVDTRKINDWLQIVGMFGVIASLIFVGLQMKQAHEIALSSIYQARSDATVDSLVSAINSPEFLSAISKLYAKKPEELTSQEAVALEFFLGADMTMFENNHRQYEMGYLSEEHWQRNLAELRCTLNTPVQRKFIVAWHYRESFMKVINDVIAQNGDNTGSCMYSDWPYTITE